MISFAGLRRTAIAVAALLVALVFPGAASAKEEGPKVTVMTRNVFLGADLGPALTAPDIPKAIDGAGVIWNEFQSTNFPERAVPLAREIKAAKPDLVGLQEVALWRKQVPSDGGAPPLALSPPATRATEVEQDFLALLLQELDAIDADYQVVRIQTEFDGELPADIDHNDNTGIPGLGGADLDARLTMRDVILAREESKVTLGDTDGANYTNRFEPFIAGTTVQLPVDRGWLSVEGRVLENETDSAIQFRFVNTHLEAFDPGVRLLQAGELITGPLNTDEQVILVGDLNSGLEVRHNIEEEPDRLAFQALTLEPPDGFGMRDNGAIHSCCYSDLFDPTQVFDHTVDHVLTKPGLTTERAYITGNDLSERTPSGLWPSDHGGVVSRLELLKK
jgi:endonuclease/exonuclease/phosphatase family metal-dependent hydrolase